MYIDGKQYFFPYRRVEALFYYLVTRKTENRRVLEDIFWGDIYDGERANRNYRNAVYRIRKDFGHDFLVKDGSRGLAVNPEAGPWVDIHHFMKQPELLRQADCLDYLSHFEAEHCLQFDLFISQKRQEYKELFYELVRSRLKAGDARMSEEICKKLIDADELCEKYYRLLMMIYGEQRDKGKIEETWRRLCLILLRELGVEPEAETGKTYERLQKKLAEEADGHGAEENPFIRRGRTDKKNSDGIVADLRGGTERILKWICLFLDPVSYDYLLFFSGLTEDMFTERIEWLVQENRIRETDFNGTIYYSMEEGKRLYDNLSLTVRRQMHGAAARRLEQDFLESYDEELLPKVIYHFLLAGAREKADEYLYKYLEGYMAVFHDFFPVAENYHIQYDADTFVKNERQLCFLMEQMETYLEQYLESVYPEQFDTRRVALYGEILLEAAVKKPDYQKAWRNIELLEALGCKAGKVSRQKAYIYINTCNAKALLGLAENMLAITRNEEPERLGFWLRMKGIGQVFAGQLKEAGETLTEAIQFFLKDEKRSLWDTNAAVAYSWLGEIYRLQKCYGKAEQYLNLSLKLTDKVHNISGKTLIYLRMGQCHLDTGRRREAGKYLKAAIRSFEWLRVNWKRSTAYGCFALLKAGEGDFGPAYDYMEKQGRFAFLIEDPFEVEFYFRCLELCRNAPECPQEIRRSIRRLEKTALTDRDGSLSGLSPYDREYLRDLSLSRIRLRTQSEEAGLRQPR